MNGIVKQLIRAASIGIILGSVSAAFCQTNLIKNGSFERPVAPYTSYLSFSTGQTFSDWQGSDLAKVHHDHCGDFGPDDDCLY